ncbi:hypothetical protein BC834DRAFT_824219, partial [Gloeopeniophorella convolvens]
TSGSGGGGKASSVPLSGGRVANGKSSATSYGAGGGRPAAIPAGQPFAGRTAGGGARPQVFGNNVYGSGYPGGVVASGGRGVAGLGLPFFFWPVVWGGAALGTAAYLHDEDEYGHPDNSTRPGGSLATAQFQSNSTGSIFRLLSDNSTVASLIVTLDANCSSHLAANGTSVSPSAYSDGSTAPRPEQALQYYRASSVTLTLDGYNDTAALNGTENAASSVPPPLPAGTDTTLLECLNQTIGLAVPLIDAGVHLGPHGMPALALAWVLAALVRSWF